MITTKTQKQRQMDRRTDGPRDRRTYERTTTSIYLSIRPSIDNTRPEQRRSHSRPTTTIQTTTSKYLDRSTWCASSGQEKHFLNLSVHTPVLTHLRVLSSLRLLHHICCCSNRTIFGHANRANVRAAITWSTEVFKTLRARQNFRQRQCVTKRQIGVFFLEHHIYRSINGCMDPSNNFELFFSCIEIKEKHSNPSIVQHQNNKYQMPLQHKSAALEIPIISELKTTTATTTTTTYKMTKKNLDL